MEENVRERIQKYIDEGWLSKVVDYCSYCLLYMFSVIMVICVYSVLLVNNFHPFFAYLLFLGIVGVLSSFKSLYGVESKDQRIPRSRLSITFIALFYSIFILGHNLGTEYSTNALCLFTGFLIPLSVLTDGLGAMDKGEFPCVVIICKKRCKKCGCCQNKKQFFLCRLINGMIGSVGIDSSSFLIFIICALVGFFLTVYVCFSKKTEEYPIRLPFRSIMITRHDIIAICSLIVAIVVLLFVSRHRKHLRKRTIMFLENHRRAEKCVNKWVENAKKYSK